MGSAKKLPDYFILSTKEEAAMKVLWNSERPLSATEIAEAIPDRTWPTVSIQNIIRSLEKKQAIKVEEITKLGKSYGRLFGPTLSANEYATMQFQRYYQKDKDNNYSVLSCLLGSDEVDKENIVQVLETLLSKYKED